jgi:hypothetical protein
LLAVDSSVHDAAAQQHLVHDVEQLHNTQQPAAE